MENELNKIQGEIVKIYRPIDGEFGFNDFMPVSFLLKTKEGYFLCCGETTPIFIGENVILTGNITTSEKGKKMDFKTIQPDLFAKASQTKFLKFICGEGTYNRIYVSALINSGRTFRDRDAEESYVNNIIISYLQNENISALQSINGIGDKTAKKIVKKFQDNIGFEKIYNDLAEYGLSLKDCHKLWKSKELKKRFGSGEKIAEAVKKNPFKLMEYVEFSFNKCDLIYSKQPSSKYNANCRVLAAISYVLKEELSKGHTYCTKEILFNNVNSMLNVTFYNEKQPIDLMQIIECYSVLVKNGRVYEKENRIYLKYIFDEEEEVRNFVSNALKIERTNTSYQSKIEEYEKLKGIAFGREQKLAIENSMNSRVSVITGGPGTGKTSSLACIIKILLDSGIYEDEIALCAPTGKAAKRMMESINGQLGTSMVATTVHTLLEVNPENPDLETFVYNKDNKLRKRVIVVDEVSMLDLKMAFSLTTATMSSTKVIFVGDIEQLPPVGAGYFLRDIILSNIPTVKLLEVHRQKGDSTIISLSQRIRDEIIDYTDLSPKSDYRFVSMPPSASFEDKMKWLVNAFKKSVEKVGLDNTMILTPLKGEIIKKNIPKSQRFGGQQICLAVQEVLLPHKDDEPEFEKNGWIFRIGSKVIVTKNDNQKGIVNGEIGYIESIDIENKKIDVDFEGETVTLDEDNIENLKLAYAITVHKSQGSEWKNVIYCCFNETAMNKKPLVYTAITRAKQNLVIVGDQSTFLNCIHNKEEYRRSRILN